MTKEKYMALADFQTLWNNSIKPYIVAGFIAMLAGNHANAKNIVLADGTNIAPSTFIAATEKGSNSGIATLDATGKVPSSQLPSFVDDVIEAYYKSADGKFYEHYSEGTYSDEITGEGGKIYTDLLTNKTYRWGGSAYTEIAAGLALGETQGTAYEGSKGAANAAAITALQSGKQDKVTASGILKGDGNGGVTAATAGTDYQTPVVFNTAYNASTNKAATMSDIPEVPERVSAEDLNGFIV